MRSCDSMLIHELTGPVASAKCQTTQSVRAHYANLQHLSVATHRCERRTLLSAMMTWTVSRQCYSQLLRESARVNSVPAFLIPAFSLPQRPQTFSTSATRQSRIGAAPLSIPPEVSLNFINLPKSKTVPRANAADIPILAVEVSGPLGSCLQSELREATCAG